MSPSWLKQAHSKRLYIMQIGLACLATNVFCVSASVALLDDGSVWAWGSNTDGQLGTGVELGAGGQGTDTGCNKRLGMSGQLPGMNTSEGSGARQEKDILHAVRVCAAKRWSGTPDPFR